MPACSPGERPLQRYGFERMLAATKLLHETRVATRTDSAIASRCRDVRVVQPEVLGHRISAGFALGVSRVQWTST